MIATPMVKRLGRILLFLLTLALAWLLWSGLFQPLLLGLGVLSCLLTYMIASRMGYFNTEIFKWKFGFRLLGYWLWLAREVFNSSVDVARVILHPKLPISPRVIDLSSTSNNPMNQVILGNSITLTPGSLTLDLHEGVVRVHTLTEAAAKDLLEGEMDRRVANLSDD